MKTINKILVTGIAAMLIFAVSCKKNTDTPDDQTLAGSVSGTYSGELKNSQTSQTSPATLTVTALNDSVIIMHCVADHFDTTVTLMLYEDYDSIMVCYTGKDFSNHYGRELDNHNFCYSKPNGWDNGWCEQHNCWGGNDNWNAWTNHLNTQHDKNDRHYGGFNAGSGWCNYSFPIKTSKSPFLYETFKGSKTK